MSLGVCKDRVASGDRGGGEHLRQNPVPQSLTHALRQTRKLDAPLPVRIGPRYPAVGLDANSRRTQVETEDHVPALVERPDGLNRHSRLGQIADDPAARLIQLDVGERTQRDSRMLSPPRHRLRFRNSDLGGKLHWPILSTALEPSD